MPARPKVSKKRISDEAKAAVADVKQHAKGRRHPTGKPGHNGTVARMRQLDDRERAWTWYVQGMTFRQIGQQLNISNVHARTLVLEAGAERWVSLKDLAPVVREVANERLNEVHRVMLPLMHGRVPNKTRVTGRGKRRKVEVVPPDVNTVLNAQRFASQRIIQVEGALAVLNGANAPMKIAPTDPLGEHRLNDMTEADVERLIVEQRIALGLPAPFNSSGANDKAGGGE